MSATASALRENKGLTELILHCCGIDAEGISQLVQALRVNTTMRVLDLSYNTIDSESAEHLGKLSGGVWGYGLVTSDSVSVPHPTERCLLSKYYCHHSLIPNHKCHIPLCLQIFHMVNIDVPVGVGLIHSTHHFRICTKYC